MKPFLFCCALALLAAPAYADPPPAVAVAPSSLPAAAPAPVVLTPVPAASPAPGGKSGQPIEINADQLEVRQQDNIAVFTGNVIAIQGDTKLKSDVMTVHYRKKEGAAASSSSGGGAFAPGQNSVERIDVDGNVVIITPTETATGDHGIYQVDARQVKLTDHVVLTRGKNVLKGDTLVHDLDTGKSVINSPFHQNEATPGAINGRVRALFVPEKSKDGQGAKP